MKNATEAMKESRVHDFLASVCASTFINHEAEISTSHAN